MVSARKPIAERGPDVIAPPPLVYLGPLLSGLILDRVLPLPRLPHGFRLLGAPVLAGGAALVAWFFTTMRRAGTPLDPREAPTSLVEEGPFALTRNPGYLGMALIYTGVSLLTSARWPLLFLPGVLITVNRGVIDREEEYLKERFGARYTDYMSRVGRWL
jgi:protein-S-isoprenylcysteine O-methyltransferase Ste14